MVKSVCRIHDIGETVYEVIPVLLVLDAFQPDIYVWAVGITGKQVLDMVESTICPAIWKQGKFKVYQVKSK